ncbi:PQQ-binding-like beta-propeller repeat protein [Nocardia carnea]|uniref:outer membrane protein assembly factor BamB family protein n=1 Tax=Nocardia carnea TaxID=37328 RepID=UPI0024557F98|nr:PQQ-binding-like beta-propeller repeat protein [Nocardia carnea]
MRIGGGVRTGSWLAVMVAAVGVLTACGTDVDDITVGRGLGWPAAGHEARNSSNTPVTGSRALSLRWSRPVGGPIAQPVTVGSEGQIFVTTRTDANCDIFSYQMPTGRKRFCNPLGPNAIYSPTLLDGASNVYVGLDSAVESANLLGQPRWRTPVAGVPTGMQFTGDGHLLVITQSGQVDVLERQTGKRMVPTQQLLPTPDFLQTPNLDWPPAGEGLEDCATGGPDCAVATIAAMDVDSGRIYATVRKPGEPDAALVALRYADGKVVQEWSRDILAGGSATDPALSADGATLYIGDNSRRLLAVDTADGKPKWEAHLDWEPRRGISVSDDGLIIPAGDDGYLMALRDTGTSYETVWERKDLALRGAPVQTAGGTGYVPAAIGDGLNLITFDTATGATVDSDVLPGASGTTTGTAVGPEGEVVVATRIGEIFTFREKP